MACFPRPVTITIWSQPADRASSTPYWMLGLSTRGSISLGWALVAGRKRVPNPAAGNTALRTFIISAVFGRQSSLVSQKVIVPLTRISPKVGCHILRLFGQKWRWLPPPPVRAAGLGGGAGFLRRRWLSAEISACRRARTGRRGARKRTAPAAPGRSRHSAE